MQAADCWESPEDLAATITLPRPMDRHAACDSAGLCFRLHFRMCAEPTAKPTAHAGGELTHSLRGGALIAHKCSQAVGEKSLTSHGVGLRTS
jgi:hypothetical protein